MLITERDGTDLGRAARGDARRPATLDGAPERGPPTTNAACSAWPSTPPSPNGYVLCLLHPRLAAQPRLALRGERRHRRAASEQVRVAEPAAADVWHQGGDLELRARRLPLHLGRRPPRRRPDVAGPDLGYNGKILRVAGDGARSRPTTRSTTAAGPNLDAIWVRGLRNPFRFSIDQATGRMFIGDVGEGTSEEVNLGVRGGNYGWPTVRGVVRGGRHDQPDPRVRAHDRGRLGDRRLRVPRDAVPAGVPRATTSSATTS